MNIEALKHNMNMWKSINEFPTYKELVKLSKKYYNNTVVYCFASISGDLYNIAFEYQLDSSFNLKYGYLSDILRGIDIPHIEFSQYFNNIRKYRFNENLKNLFNDYKKFESELKYYTHISSIYILIKNSINVVL